MHKKYRGSFLQEIRINPEYSLLGYSKYDENSSNKDSETVIQNNLLLTNDYTLKLSKNMNGDKTIFPPNCRYLEHTDKGTLVIIEEPPSKRTISVSIKMSELINRLDSKKLKEYGYDYNELLSLKSPIRFTLAFPYVIFIMFFNDYFENSRGKVFLRTSQMSGFSDNLLKNPMLNINSEQNVCLGDRIVGKHQSLYEAVNKFIDIWWGSSFNFDYRDNYNRYKTVPIINNYLEWQYFSQYDPMFIFSANWIPYKDNIHTAIENVKYSANARERVGLTYGDMVKLFTKPIETGTVEKPSKKMRKEYKLYYDIAQSVYLNEEIVLNVGDTVTLKDGTTAFVYSFVGFRIGGNIKYVQLEQNGKIYTMRFEAPFIKFMIEQILKNRYAQEVKLKNGNIIKAGDILSINIDSNQKVYKKVDYIRRGRIINDEEVFEIKCGGDYYLSNKFDAEVFNIKNPKIDNILLNENDSYILIKEPTSVSTLIAASRVKFDRVDITTDGILYAVFSNKSSSLKNEKHTLYIDNFKGKMPSLLKEDKVSKLEKGVCRVGRKLFYLSDNSKISDAIWTYNGCLLYENYFSLSRPGITMLKDLIKNNETFHVVGVDFDTTFKIGDKVVVADWTKPIDVLNVKTIQGFTFDSSTGNISFALMSKDNKMSSEIYVEGANGDIRTGYIRRVTNKYDKLEVGTKIIANKSGICNFPKKDVNIVVAIIDDGPYEPLVLCSNGCTLWYSTIMKDFRRISVKSKKWKTLQHAPLDMSKIKFQSGDIINGRRDFRCKNGYILFDPASTRYLKALHLKYYSGGFPEHETFDRYFNSDAIFECIPNPRISIAQQNKIKVVRGFVDFHGGVIPDPDKRSKLLFLDERGGTNV